MKHIQRQMASDEHLVYRVRHHWWPNLKTLGFLNLFNEIAVTDRRIIRKKGIFSVDIQSLPFDILESRDVHQSFGARIFGYGNVTLHGTGGRSETFVEISRPIEFLQRVDDAIVKRG